MALQLSKEMPSGVTGDYWKIVHLQLIKDTTTTVSVALYKDQAAREADKQSLEALSYTWSGADNPCTVEAMNEASSNPFKLCYDKLKTLPEFAGAVDA